MTNALDRTMVAENLLDRVDWIESTLRDVLDNASTPQNASQNPENPDWSTISGWVITGTQFRDVYGKVVLDSTIPSITLAAGGIIESSDYVANTSGFHIDGGTAEFNDIVIRGTIYATVGEIGGWEIQGTQIISPGGEAVLNSTGYLRLGITNDVVELSSVDANYRLWVGHATAASAPFRVTKAGALTASNADITGTIDANAGHIGALDVDGLLTVGTVAPLVQIDGPNKRIRTSDYVAGLTGWNIDTTGAEFANVRVRGAIHASIFEKSTISAVGGSWVVAKSAATIKTALVIDNTAVPFANTAHLIVNDPPGGGWLFDTNDIIRAKAVYSGGVADTWMTVTRTGTTNEYTITVNNGTVNYTIPAGTGIVDYGPGGQGFFAVSADGTLGASAAWVLGSHAGTPWTTTTAQVYAGSDGKLYAGAGAVKIDADGISLATSVLYEGADAYKFVNPATGDLRSYIHGQETALINQMIATVQPIAGKNSMYEVLAYSPTTKPAYIDLDAESGAVISKFQVYCKDDATPYCYSTHSILAALTSGGLNVGGAAIPNNGDAWITTDVRIGGGLYVGSLATDPGADNLIVDGTGYFGGNVGLGVTPTTKLHVHNGTFRISTTAENTYLMQAFTNGGGADSTVVNLYAGAVGSTNYPNVLLGISGGGWGGGPTGNQVAILASMKNAGTTMAFWIHAYDSAPAAPHIFLQPNTGFIGLTNIAPASRLDMAAGALTMSEMSAPSAPAANGVVIYAVDNGAGKTQLMAKFTTGAAQQLAIQP